MGLEQERLLSLIEFATESAKLRGNPICDVARHEFGEYEHTLQGLPGIHFNKGGEEDEVWLTVERLKEATPPTPKNPLLELWINLSNNPAIEPTLKGSIEFSKLIESGLVQQSPAEVKELVLLAEFSEAAELNSLLKAYIKTQWHPWSNEEKRRRRTIQIYGKLFTLKQQLEGSITDAQVEIAWGVGMAIWNMGGIKVSYPLMSKLVDISINDKSMAIEIRPRDIEARLELDIYASVNNLGTSELEKIYKKLLAKSTQTFSPFDRSTYDPVLQSAVACLDPKGIYWPGETKADDRSLPTASEELKVTDTWVLLARPRSKSLFIQDLERFKDILEDEKNVSIPQAILAVLKEPLKKNKDIALPSFRGLSMVQGYGNESKGKSEKSADLYFPMPFNDEQVRIIQLLEQHDGVVVQGPPGTGKTHTIANIIAHYFANGKRVLVTSMKEPALAVLRDKLPEEIRPLAISLLSSEREGMKQFEHAITRIASEIQSIDKTVYKKDITLLEQNVDGLHATLARVDRNILEWAKKNIDPIIIDKDSITPTDAAEEVVKGAGQYEWLEDKLLPDNTALFNNKDIARLREARREVAKDMHYLGVSLPEISAFLDSHELMRIHQDLSRHAELEAEIDSGDLPPLSSSKKEVVEKAHQLLDKIKAFSDLNQEISNGGKWCINARKLLKQPKTDIVSIIEIFDALGKELTDTVSERTNFLAKPVSAPKDIELDIELTQAIANKVNGKSPFGLGGLIGKAEAKKKLEEIRILNSQPSSQEDWKHVQAYVILQKSFRDLLTRWNGVASELQVEAFIEIDPAHAMEAAQFYSLHLKLREHIKLEQDIIKQAKQLMPTWKKASEIEKNPKHVKELQDFLDSHTLRHRLASAWTSKEQLQKILSPYKSTITDEFKKFLASTLGNPTVHDAEMQAKWSSLMDELKRVSSLRSSFTDIQEICGRIEKSGAKKWAEKLMSVTANETIDPLLPDNWQSAWRLKRLADYLEAADATEHLKKLSHERTKTEKQLANTYKEAISKRTWLKLAENATPEIRAALEAFRTAVSKIGRGTGKRAVIHRQNARNASDRANQAIPCWIMPHWRVSESLPANFGCFDLVIIDEASQSDFAALPALLRANKVLIVGDEKQVSPDGAFMEVDKIKNLMTRYLKNQVDIYRAQMDPGQSIYDLFKVVFAQSGVMLKEHFRCVGPIIEYSKREFYNHEIKPVRLPKASERLDPPLVDVLVEDGFRKGDINLPEARFIVDEIKKICSDEKMQRRTIGVVSLLADKQSLKIWEMLEDELGPEEIQRHEIACGDARTFQGKERDIMFLSMIVSAGDAHAQNRDSNAQRLNVAASRARDRMYLVRSIELDQLSPNDKLRRNLISHFAVPYAQNEQRVENLRSLCESDFEREIYDLLTERGYRVIPQVRVGEYRIDMVVEGHNDTRLAIECDGDQYHGIEQWENDMNRQRILERVGWQFWRSFASNFVKNRKEVIDDLINALNERGIEPIGKDDAPRSIHTEQRRVIALPPISKDKVIEEVLEVKEVVG